MSKRWFRGVTAPLRRFVSPQPGGHHVSDKAVATLGGCLSIYLITHISIHATGYSGAAAIVPSMGAATVLLFAVPHGPMSQPWALFVGNLLSAVVGVSCARWIADPILAACLAVGLAIAVMHLFRCVHPPGGATALAAVIGGESIRSLGYEYVVAPTLLNCLVIFSVAVLFNNIFPWRRYPVALMKYQSFPQSPGSSSVRVDLRHIHQAVEEAEVLIDTTTEQVYALLRRAQQLANTEQSSDLPIEVGAFYTNDRPGVEWAVRQVLEENRHSNPAMDQIVYRVVAGSGAHKRGVATREEFALWVKRRVHPVSDKGH